MDTTHQVQDKLFQIWTVISRIAISNFDSSCLCFLTCGVTCVITIDVKRTRSRGADCPFLHRIFVLHTALLSQILRLDQPHTICLILDPIRSSFKCSGHIPSPNKCSVALPTKNFSNRYNGALTNPSPFKIIAFTTRQALMISWEWVPSSRLICSTRFIEIAYACDYAAVVNILYSYI